MIKNVGFIGAGVMGKSMIRNLMKKGFQVQFIQEQSQKPKTLSQKVPSGVILPLSVLKARTSSSPLSVSQRMWRKLILAKKASLPIPKTMSFSLI